MQLFIQQNGWNLLHFKLKGILIYKGRPTPILKCKVRTTNSTQKVILMASVITQQQYSTAPLTRKMWGNTHQKDIQRKHEKSICPLHLLQLQAAYSMAWPPLANGLVAHCH
jgi:hypothetical protein